MWHSYALHVDSLPGAPIYNHAGQSESMAITVDREIFVAKIFRRWPLPTKIKHSKYFVYIDL